MVSGLGCESVSGDPGSNPSVDHTCLVLDQSAQETPLLKNEGFRFLKLLEFKERKGKDFIYSLFKYLLQLMLYILVDGDLLNSALLI